MEPTEKEINDAIEIIMFSKKASPSFLQRKLQIGYFKAAKILEKLQEMGYVGPSHGAMPREILK